MGREFGKFKGKERFGLLGSRSSGKGKGYWFPFPLPQQPTIPSLFPFIILSCSTEHSLSPLLHSVFFPTNLNPSILSLFPVILSPSPSSLPHLIFFPSNLILFPTPPSHVNHCTCRPHVHHMYTTYVPHIYTTCIPHVHHMNITCTPHLHHKYTIFTLFAQHVNLMKLGVLESWRSHTY